MIPQSNASLVGVQRGGTSEDYAADAGDGPFVFDTAIDAYVYERRESRQIGGIWDRVAVRFVLVEPVVQFTTGDVLTIEHAGATKKVKVAAVRDSQISTLPPQPVRLELG